MAKKKECRGLAGPVGRYIGNEHMAQDGHERELVCDLASQGSTFEAEGDMVLKSTKLTPKHGFGMVWGERSMKAPATAARSASSTALSSDPKMRCSE